VQTYSSTSDQGAPPTEQSLCHVFDVAFALPEIVIINCFKLGDQSIGNPFNRRFRVNVFFVDNLLDLVGKNRVG